MPRRLSLPNDWMTIFGGIDEALLMSHESADDHLRKHDEEYQHLDVC
jgi:hypothetical protein